MRRLRALLNLWVAYTLLGLLMARKHEAETLLRTGLSPVQIADEMGIGIDSVLQYLRLRVGEGGLKLSDLLFAIPSESRAAFAAAITERNGELKVNWRKLPKGYNRKELDLYKQLSSHVLLAGDLYEHIAAIEVHLHDIVRAQLLTEYGDPDWWQKGVPDKIRQACICHRKEDAFPCDDDFSYTNLIHLKVLVEKNWKIFANVFPPRWSQDKKALLSGFNRLNALRNGVMHPVKKRQWTEADFEFVRVFRRGLRDCLDRQP